MCERLDNAALRSIFERLSNIIRLVAYTELNCSGEGGSCRSGPNDQYAPDHSGQRRKCMGLQRMTDGQITFYRKRHDGQDRGVGGHLGYQSPQDAERLAECVRILPPQLVQLLRKTCKKERTVKSGTDHRNSGIQC